MKKGQAAMEFLMTYGWAIIVVLITIGALAYFGVLRPERIFGSSCVLQPGLSCEDFRVDSESVTLIIRNGLCVDIKDVDVSFANYFEPESPTLQIVQNLPDNLLGGLPFLGNLIIKNTGKEISASQDLIIYSSVLKPYYQKINLSQIPPFGNKTIPISFLKTSLLTNKEDVIRISLGGTTLFHTVGIFPFFLNKWVFLGGGVIVTGIFIISIIAFKPWNLSIFRQKG